MTCSPTKSIAQTSADDLCLQPTVIPVAGTHRVPGSLIAVLNSPSWHVVSSHQVDCPILTCCVYRQGCTVMMEMHRHTSYSFSEIGEFPPLYSVIVVFLTVSYLTRAHNVWRQRMRVRSMNSLISRGDNSHETCPHVRRCLPEQLELSLGAQGRYTFHSCTICTKRTNES